MLMFKCFNSVVIYNML